MLSIESLRNLSLPKRQEYLKDFPHLVDPFKDYDRIYNQGQIDIGWPNGAMRRFEHLARENTVAIIGSQLGDEAKGRIVDNKLEGMFRIKGVKSINVIRFQGGNNAGHTVEKDGKKLDLHLVPSGIMYEKTAGIMDQGMIIHAQDLKTEIEYIEDSVGDLRGKLFLSQDAILATDIERAEEVANRQKEDATKGGTGRGIGPANAHHIDKTGKHVRDLLDNNWRKKFALYYELKQKDLEGHEIDLATMEVPDFKKSRLTGREEKQTVGTKEEFLDRLEVARSWIIDRNMATNVYIMHRDAFWDATKGFIFEGAQAAGLDAFTGTHPDRTSSNTTAYGVRDGTAYWTPEKIFRRIGVVKVPYMSSVGTRIMPTHIHPEGEDGEWSVYVRETAREYGTTTRRPRDIAHIDLPFLAYNAAMAGIEEMAVTHLDVARKDTQIKVCVAYKDKKTGEHVPYQPGLHYQQDVEPQYIILPGWDGQECMKAKSLKDLPLNAVKFMAFLQARLGYPITSGTNGPDRHNYFEINQPVSV